MQGFDETACVRGTVEKIRIAKRNVLDAGRNLLLDIREDDVDGDDAEVPVIDRHDRAMTAPVLAAARCIGRADEAARPVGHL